MPISVRKSPFLAPNSPLCVRRPHFLRPEGTFSAPNPNLCSPKSLKLEFLAPKWDFFFFRLAKEVLNQNCGFGAQKKVLFSTEDFSVQEVKFIVKNRILAPNPHFFTPKLAFFTLECPFLFHNPHFCHLILNFCSESPFLTKNCDF